MSLPFRCFLLACSNILTACPASDKSILVESDFIRFVEEGEGGHLDTAIVSYENEEGCRVDLISAVHLGDPAYYSELEIVFTAYDALLYELVASSDMRPAKERRDSDSLLSLFQRSLCRALRLEFQLDSIDYTKPNFVHADLTPRQFVEIWREKGITIWGLLLQTIVTQLKAMEGGMGKHLTGAAVIEALRSKDRAAGIKLLLAKEFEQIEMVLAGFEPGEEGDESILLGERNKAAIKVLKKQISRGKKRLAIFYGCAHMPDFEHRLQRGLGFRKTGQEWLCAWRIEIRKETE